MSELTITPQVAEAANSRRTEAQVRKERDEAVVRLIRRSGEAEGLSETEIREAETAMRMSLHQAHVMKAVMGWFR